MSDNGFVEYILDLLSPYGNIRSRRMFGGYGIYLDKLIFALIIDNELYFKVNDSLFDEYKQAGSYPFTYQRNGKTITFSYWYIPVQIIENQESLKEWFNKSIIIVKEAKRKKSL